MNHVDTIIVGGGLSGLYAAKLLQQQRKSYALFEAKPGFGGRICTHSLSGVDLGPAWYWQDNTRFSSLVNEYGLTRYTQYSKGEGLFETASGIVRIPMPHAATSFRVEGGMRSVIDALVSGLDQSSVYLEHHVTVLEKIDDTVQVSIENNMTKDITRWRCHNVLMCLPPRVVAHSLQFTPMLPESIQTQWKAVPTWMAGHAKAVMSFPTAVWREQGLSGFIYSQRGPLAEIHDASTDKGPALFGFFGLPASTRSQHSTQVLIEAIAGQCERTVGVRPSSVDIMDWAGDTLVATPADQDNGSEHPRYGMHTTGVWNDQVVLCSTESSAENGGYMEGALLSAACGVKRIGHE